MRVAFVEPLTLELDETSVQIPLCGGGKQCYPASNPRLLAVFLAKILCFVFKPRKPPRLG